jgi:hypothetical protein
MSDLTMTQTMSNALDGDRAAYTHILLHTYYTAQAYAIASDIADPKSFANDALTTMHRARDCGRSAQNFLRWQHDIIVCVHDAYKRLPGTSASKGDHSVLTECSRCA